MNSWGFVYSKIIEKTTENQQTCCDETPKDVDMSP